MHKGAQGRQTEQIRCGRHTPRSIEVDVSAEMDPLVVAVAMKVSRAK